MFIDLERNVEVGSNESDITLEFDSKELKYVLDVLKDLGINIKPNKKNRIYKYDISDYVIIRDSTQFADDIYVSNCFIINVDGAGKIINLEISSSVYSGFFLKKFEVFKSGNDKFSSFYNPEELDNVVTEDKAFEKLCNGECYADGLNEAVKNGSVDIVIYNADIIVQRDDRGYMEYVYCFYIKPITTPDGTVIDMLYVPAMKSYY